MPALSSHWHAQCAHVSCCWFILLSGTELEGRTLSVRLDKYA